MEPTKSLSTSSAADLGTTPLGDSGCSGAMARHLERLRSNRKEFLLLDGGTGEELFRRGVPDDRKTWSATACVHPQYHATLQSVHRSYIEAGSDVITTNSYGITPGVGFTRAEVSQHVRTAGRLARESLSTREETEDAECTAQGAEDSDSKKMQQTLVCGSLGPLVESYRPDKFMPHAEGVATYKVMVEALQPYVDCFIAETMSSLEEASQAVEAVAAAATTLTPMMVSFTLDSHGKMRDGDEVPDALRRIIQCAADNKVNLVAILFNCCEPESITLALRRIRQDEALQAVLEQGGILLGAYANRLTPIAPDWSMAESDGPQPFRSDLDDPADYFHPFVASWFREMGVQILGGCCGFAPPHIRYIRRHMATLQ